jgi:hypothetical protein
VTRSVFTLAYFIRMVGLMNMPDSPDAVAVATRWSHLNYLRHAIVFAARALRALALLHSVEGAREHAA